MVDVAEGAQLAKNIDWNRVASYYDAYVRTDLDLSFFLKHARESDGPLLELMCGPGRITMPLVEAGYDVTGIDSSSGLLDRFRAKLLDLKLRAHVVEADVRSFDLGRTFPLVFIGFHSFSEVLGAADRLRAIFAIRRHVAAHGRLVLTLHNPVVRAANVHEEWRTMGTFPLASGRMVEVGLRRSPETVHSCSPEVDHPEIAIRRGDRAPLVRVRGGRESDREAREWRPGGRWGCGQI